jgi:cyclopropane fatty-acyl-phospholipid synthase-like methyltransferase
MQETPWWTVRFELLAAAVPGFLGGLDATAAAQVDWVCSLCGLESGARVLDLGCGAGRHTILMAERGLDVTGMDLSPKLLKMARERWTERNPETPGPLFAPGDMRWPSVPGPFDAVIMLDVTLGVFQDDADHARTLAAVRERLKPGGHLVLELFNPYFWAHNQTTHHFPIGTLSDVSDVVRTYRFDPIEGRVVDQVTLFDAMGAHRVPDQRLRVWTPPELMAMLTTAGFSQVQVMGSVGWQVPRAPQPVLADTSVYLWVVAQA